MALLLAGIAATPISADIPLRRQLTLYLFRQGQPYHGAVDYTVRCYGYTYEPGPDPERAPGSYTPEEIYSFQAECPGFACKTLRDTYLNYLHIDRCDLEVRAEGQRYVVDNYGRSPFGQCTSAGLGIDADEACELRVDIPELPASATPMPGPGESPTSPDGWLAGQPLAVLFLLALLITWLVELPIVWLLARYALRLRRVGTARLLGVGLLATALTLPYLWFLLPDLLSAQAALWLGEALVFAVELGLYRWLLPANWRQAALLSLAANAASLLVGLALF